MPQASGQPLISNPGRHYLFNCKTLFNQTFIEATSVLKEIMIMTSGPFKESKRKEIKKERKVKKMPV